MAYSNIDKPNQYFNTYTGNNSTGHAITGVGFQPDWTWIKERSSTSSHFVNDSVRGAGENIYTDLTSAEGTNTALFTSFDSDGFTIGNTNQGNESGQTYVAWNWLAGGTASENTDGTITSQVSANTTSGFSIVSYTGTGANATVGHGLGSAPKFIILKARDAARDWNVYNGGISNMAGGYIILNATDAFSTAFSTIWNNTDPTSSVFSVGTANTSNNLNTNYIAYCFAEKKGFSKFGSYTGNGSTDGPFIYTGFKPAWVLLKISSGTTGAWTLFDNKRDPFNEVDNRLFPNSTNVEADGNDCDFLSNGFKHRTTGSGTNFNGYTYIYMAFAESPLVGSNLVPNNAR